MKTYKPDSSVTILSDKSSGIIPTFSEMFTRRTTTKTTEEIILDTLDFGAIERYVRKKKLERLNNHE
jgi:hypothetical protein